MYLKDVKIAELKAIMQFINLGKVEVREEDLDGLMKTANFLQIEGLMGNSSVRNAEFYSEESEDASALYPIDDVPILETQEMLTFINESNVEENMLPFIIADEAPAPETKLDNGKIIENTRAKTKSEKFDCLLCEYSTNHSSHLKQHVLSIHEKSKIPCKECDKVFATT